jgi:hypothetical protein
MAKHKSMITPLESQEQKAIVKWLSYHPVVRDYFLKLNNEGKRTEATGWHLKQLGLRAGASDLFIYYPTKTYHGLWLEVKRNKKYTPSERSTPTWISQEKFIESVKKVGFAGEFCYGLECGIKIIESYLLT